MRLQFPGQLFCFGDSGVALLCFVRSFQIKVRFVRVVHIRHQPEVVFMRDRIELVRMTLSTLCRQAQPGRAGGGDAIGHRVVAKLQRIDSAFFIEHRVAMKARGHQLALRRVGKHIAGKLLDCELIKRHVVVDRADHPIAIRPDAAIAIFFVAVGVGVARQIKPLPGPSFSVTR